MPGMLSLSLLSRLGAGVAVQFIFFVFVSILYLTVGQADRQVL